MTRNEMIAELRVLGMTQQGERELKLYLQLVDKCYKADSHRKQRQQEYRVRKLESSCMGLGFSWYQEALHRGFLK